MFEIELLIIEDIKRQIEDAERDEKWDYHGAAIHRCKTAKGFCESLIGRLDEIVEKG